MKITIDDKICAKQKLAIEECLMALAVKMAKDPEQLWKDLLSREIIVKKPEGTMITQRWSDTIDEIICDSTGLSCKDQELLAFAKELRLLFPEGKQTRASQGGVHYYYRCNATEIMQSLKRFFTYFGEYPLEDIKDATKRYVAHFRGDYESMRIIKYFIIKDERNKGKDITSDLATYLDNKEEGEESKTEDWTTKMV